MKNPRKLPKNNGNKTTSNRSKSKSALEQPEVRMALKTIDRNVVSSNNVKSRKINKSVGADDGQSASTCPRSFFWCVSSPDPSDDDHSDDEGDIDRIHALEDPTTYPKHAHRMLEISCLRFRDESYYGPDIEQKICIWSGGDPFSWTEKSSGISWIGVQGTEFVCVLSSSEQDLLRWRPYGRYQMSVRSVHANAVADMGFWTDISTKSTEFRRRIAQSSKAGGPFAIVSIAPNSIVDAKHLEISDECQQQASRAINFLEAKLKGCSSLTIEETGRIAVCALKYLLGPKFKENEIEGFGFDKFKGPMGPDEADVRKMAMDLDVMDLSTSASSLSV